jgi:DNA-binding FadR family transcriptional regulator
MAKPESTTPSTVEFADPAERAPHDSPLWTLQHTRSAIDRGSKISERVASAIVDDIVASDLQPGDRLPNEAAMIERFQVGRGSLREALRILEVHGLISLRSGPNGGPFVVAVDPRSVSRTLSLYLHLSGSTMGELVETRMLIEPMVARLAAQQIGTADNAARLRTAIEEEAATSADNARYVDAANDFHYVVSSLTGNRVFDVVATALKELYTTRVVGSGLASETTEPSIRFEHLEIGEAILAGDGDEAEALMRAHMDLYLHRAVRADPNFAGSVIDWS